MTFQGAESVILGAEKVEDFQNWMSLFTMYDLSGSPKAANSVAMQSSHLGYPSSRHGPSNTVGCSRSVHTGLLPVPGGQQKGPLDFASLYRQSCSGEPSPEPSPGFRMVGMHEDYDPGAMEMSAPVPHLGPPSLRLPQP